MLMIKRIIPGILILGVLNSCTPEDPGNENNKGYAHGAYITNEGAFGNSNGSLSFLPEDSVGVINHLFEQVNGRPLGDVVQSFSVAGNRGFIVVNNSQKVEVIDLESFESIGVIAGLEYPRYFLAVNENKGYLTDGNFAGRVLVVDLNTLQIRDTIAVGAGPEHLILKGDRVIVANSGGWGNDSTLTLIDAEKDAVIDTWNCGYNPTDLVVDRDDNLWVLCKGKVTWEGWNIAEETESEICIMDSDKGEIRKRFTIGSVGDFFWPMTLGVSDDGRTLYCLEASGIYSLNYKADGLPENPLVPGYFYGFGIEPSTDRVFALAAPSFTAAGWLIRYNSDGSLVDSLSVGIGPNRVAFN